MGREEGPFSISLQCAVEHSNYSMLLPVEGYIEVCVCVCMCVCVCVYVCVCMCVDMHNFTYTTKKHTNTL